MKYLMLVCWDAARMDAQTEPDPAETRTEESFPWLDDLRARGIWVTGDQLAPPRRGRSVRVRDGKAIVTDGPFVATKEAIGGFDILECGSLEEAVEIAAEHPIARPERSRSGRFGGTDDIPARASCGLDQRPMRSVLSFV